MTNTQALITILIMAVFTLITRALPFLLFSGDRKPPAIIPYLGRVLPYAIMGMLVVYCLRNIDIFPIQNVLPEVIGVGATAALYLWRKHSLLAIVGGTAVYMVALRVFV